MHKLIVYRITLTKWANSLKGSGYPARWNSKGTFVVYTAGSIALATLENLVHRSGEGLNASFKIIKIEIPKSVKIKTAKQLDLPKDWYKIESYPKCQKIGDTWIEEGKTAVLKIPSSIVQDEYNFLINPNHKDFKKIKIKSTHPFAFDPRLKK